MRYTVTLKNVDGTLVVMNIVAPNEKDASDWGHHQMSTWKWESGGVKVVLSEKQDEVIE